MSSSSSSTWKSYGGTNHLETANEITVSELTVDTLSLKNAYSGVFKVIGDIYTTGNVNISNNLDISGDINSYGDLNVYGSMLVYKNINIKKRLYLGDNNTNTPTDTTNPFFYASQLFVGLNTTTPVSPLDISINTECGVFFHSSNSVNKNVITKNNNNYGIIASANDMSSCISFYNASSILDPSNDTIDISGLTLGDATIALTNNDLVLSSTNSVVLNTPTVFTTDLSTTTLKNEFVTIYDSPNTSTIYNYNRYRNTSYEAGKALTLVGYGSKYSDISAGTFLSIVNINSIGAGIVAGPDPENITEPFSSTGLFINKQIKKHLYPDTSYNTTLVSNNYFIPIQTTATSSSRPYNRTSIGINNTIPIKNTFLMDINGPVRITNTDFFHDTDVSFQIVKAEHLCGNTNFIVAIGSPTITSSGLIKDTILISTNGGENWKYVFDPSLSLSATTTTNKTFDNINIYNENIILLSNKSGQILISFEQGIEGSWFNIINTLITSSIPIIGFTKLIDNTIGYDIYLTILYDSAKERFVKVIFTQDNITGLLIKEYNVDSTQAEYIHELSTLITDPSFNTTNGSTITGIACKSIPFYLTTYSGYFYLTTSNGIYKIKFAPVTVVNPKTNGLPFYPNFETETSYNTTYKYNDVKIFTDTSFAIFVGDGIISYTKDGTNFYDSNIVDKMDIYDRYDKGDHFDTINIYSLNVATAVGKNGTQIYYTTDGAETWSRLSTAIMNSTGIYAGIVPPLTSPLINVFMTSENTLLIFGAYKGFTANSNGLSKIFKGYIPQIFSSSSNTVFDVCGNSNIWGNVNIQDNIKISGNAIVVGNTSVSGNALISKNVAVSGNATVSGNVAITGNTNISKVLTCDSSAVINELIVNGIATFNGTIQSYGDISCSTNTYTKGNSVVYGNVNVLSDLTVSGTIYTLTNLSVANDTHLTGTLYAYSDISCATDIYTLGNVVVYGNVEAETNINVANSLYVTQSIYSKETVYALTNLDVSGNTICRSNVDICSNLTVYGDVSLNTDFYVSGYTILEGNVLIVGNLSLVQWFDLSRNPLMVGSLTSISTITAYTDVFIGNTLYVNNDTSVNGILYVNEDISGNANINLSGNADISGSLTTHGNINCKTTINTPYIDGTGSNSTLYIGSDNTDTINICNSTGKTINVSYSSSTNYTNTINIGNDNDSIYVRGNSVVFSPSFRSTNSKIQLLDGNQNTAVSRYAGLYICDNSNNDAAYIRINYNRNGFLIKSPESTNILNINTTNITLTNATDFITGNSIDTGLLVFKHTDDGAGTGNIVKTIGTASIDVSNIFIKDHSLSTNTLQYIPTNTSISGILRILPKNSITTDSTNYTTGAIVITGGLGISGSVHTNSSVSAGGIMYCKSGTVSTNYTTGSLVVTGGVGVSGEIFTSGNVFVGYGVKVLGNITSTGSTTGSLVVSGGTGISGRVFVDGSTNIGGIATITNTTASSSVLNGALVVSGGIGVSGNLNAKFINIENGDESTDISSGAIVVSGGIGIKGNAFVKNTVNILGGISSTTTSSGTLIVTGGTGVSGNVSVGENVMVGGYITTPSLFVGKIAESISTVAVVIDSSGVYTATVDYSAIPSIVYLNTDVITTTNRITIYLTNIPTTHTNKIFTLNIIIPTTPEPNNIASYIDKIYANGENKTNDFKFNGGTENIFVDSNDVTLQSFTFIFTNNPSTPAHIISSISSYYE